MGTWDNVGTEGQTIQVERWPSEIPLLILVILISLGLWVLFIISVIGAMYALIIAVFLFISHVGFIAYLRGSAVRIGPEQFSKLHQRIVELSNKAGLDAPPEAYLMQAGGALNALAAKLFRSKFIVLYSDMLEACGDNLAARDMIIGHELGHLKARHLSFIWLIIPGMIAPFIGPAYSRAREYTCDRYGFALSGQSEDSLRGLAILAAGAKYGPQLDLRVFAKQRRSLNTGFMTFGIWFASHPPLSDRVVALEPRLAEKDLSRIKGDVRAVGIIVLTTALFVAVSVGGMAVFRTLANLAPSVGGVPEAPAMTLSVAEATEKVNLDFITLAVLVDSVKNETGRLPSSENGTLSALWQKRRPSVPEPIDPFDGYSYGYHVADDSVGFFLWSSGADRVTGTDDDIIYNSVDPSY